MATAKDVFMFDGNSMGVPVFRGIAESEAAKIGD
jgi:hypothetical protein